MIRRPPRSTLSSSSAASDVYKRQQLPPVAARQSILLSTLWEEHESLSDFDRCHSWVLYVRVAWKSKLRKIVGGGDAADGSSAASSRCVFDAIVVDERGDAVKVVFNGGRKLHDKFQVQDCLFLGSGTVCLRDAHKRPREDDNEDGDGPRPPSSQYVPSHFPVSYTHLRAHETPEHLVCRLLLEKKKNTKFVIETK
eukprot:TRINITY_DN33508_c0_g1_i1.p1 TRINITY_DN33508_c0_g1~~TRINITY_DN33508_c0_g1_i1.p1  ORF type:complete len:196 (-),score=42.83 TRINITY_DN33508_c0_g1_i1:13-600(-)